MKWVKNDPEFEKRYLGIDRIERKIEGSYSK